MKLSRRQAIRVSCTTLAGLSLARRPTELHARPQQSTQAPPDALVDTAVRNIAPLPLLPDGSAPEHSSAEAGPISEPTLWRYTGGEPPAIDFDYRNLKVKVDGRRTAKRTGTLRFADLEALPEHSQITLLQCGAPNPRGVVKWTGVRFADLADLLEVQPFAHYCRIVASDGYWIEEGIETMRHPQVMLAWKLNDEPLPPKHGAPLRLVMPFRYGARSLKAVQEIYFTATSFPLPALPAD